jgi:hypothetical protein
MSTSLRKEFNTLLPRIRDCEKHKNRALMLDLINPLIKKVEKKLNSPLNKEEHREEYVRALRMLKQFVIMSAWRTEEEDRYTQEVFKEDVGIPDGLVDENEAESVDEGIASDVCEAASERMEGVGESDKEADGLLAETQQC